jgi:hypothetical protein
MSDPRLDASRVKSETGLDGSEIGLGGSRIGCDPSLNANIYVTELGLLRLILYWQGTKKRLFTCLLQCTNSLDLPNTFDYTSLQLGL